MNIPIILDKIEKSERVYFDSLITDIFFTNNQIMNYIDYLIYNIPEYIEDLENFYKKYGIDDFYKKILNIINDIVNKNKEVFLYINKKYSYKILPILKFMINNKDDTLMVLQNGNDINHIILCMCYKNQFKNEYDYLINNYENDDNELKLFQLTKNSYFNCIKIENNIKTKIDENIIYINVYI